MKKVNFILIIVIFGIKLSISQTYSAKLAIDSISIAELKAGDKVTVPIKLLEKSGGVIVGFQFFIEFDHSLFTWMGTSSNPLNGVKNINENMPYNSNDWLFNDNGNQMVALWLPTDMEVDIKEGDVFFEYIFTYNGNYPTDKETLFSWGTFNEQKEGRIVRGKTEMYSEKLDLYKLSFSDGVVSN